MLPTWLRGSGSSRGSAVSASPIEAAQPGSSPAHGHTPAHSYAGSCSPPCQAQAVFIQNENFCLKRSELPASRGQSAWGRRQGEPPGLGPGQPAGGSGRQGFTEADRERPPHLPLCGLRPQGQDKVPGAPLKWRSQPFPTDLLLPGASRGGRPHRRAVPMLWNCLAPAAAREPPGNQEQGRPQALPSLPQRPLLPSPSTRSW